MKLPNKIFTFVMCALLVSAPRISVALDYELYLAQTKLRILGYSVGAVDGINGANTKHAITQFQTDNGLKITGVLDDATKLELIPSHVQSTQAFVKLVRQCKTYSDTESDLLDLQKLNREQDYVALDLASSIQDRLVYASNSIDHWPSWNNGCQFNYSFLGNTCTDRCQGHLAGYEWASMRNLNSDYLCKDHSYSFETGCTLFANGY